MTTGYYSSEEKDIVRERFDLPLIEKIYESKADKLRYFGLPGEEVRDLKCWEHLLNYVSAVEMSRPKYDILKHRLATEFEFRFRAHLGDLDEVILNNGIRGRKSDTFVSTVVDSQGRSHWNFDIVYLDYYGKLLPYNRGDEQVQNRANAIRRLFGVDREDAHQPWLLMLTIEASYYDGRDRTQMRLFLESNKLGVNREHRDALNYLLQQSLSPNAQAVRLIHGTVAHIIAAAATNADVRVKHRATVEYEGSHGTPMLHFAFEIHPSDTLTGLQDALSLIQAPILGVKNPPDSPWFELSGDQPPGQTVQHIKDGLDFLDSDDVERIVASIS